MTGTIIEDLGRRVVPLRSIESGQVGRWITPVYDAVVAMLGRDCRAEAVREALIAHVSVSEGVGHAEPDIDERAVRSERRKVERGHVGNT